MKAGIKILRVLKSNKNRFVSGQDLGSKFKISRTAIWKTIQRLKKKGYNIISRKKEGYKLLNVPDFLLPTEIQDGLNTRFIGKQIYYFNQIDSTNEKAKKLALTGAIEGTVVISEKQTKGRGRLGRYWVSPPGGIWLSIILRPKFSPQDSPITTMIATLAVAKAIKQITGIDVKIKWPNDVVIYIKNRQKTGKKQVLRKVCGILVEMVAEVDRINYLVIGIGINVNNHIPKNIQNIACSLKELGIKISRSILTKRILEQFEHYYCLMLQKGAGYVLRELKTLSAVLSKTVKVNLNNQIITGKVIDINEKGSLVLRLKNGAKKEIVAGDVSLSDL